MTEDTSTSPTPVTADTIAADIAQLQADVAAFTGASSSGGAGTPAPSGLANVELGIDANGKVTLTIDGQLEYTQN